MSHGEFKELLLLSFSGPLEEDEQASLDRHLSSCADCRKEAAMLRKVAEAVESGGAGIKVDDRLLQEARQEFRVALRNEITRRHSWSRRLQEIFTLPRLGYAFAAAGVFAAGILLGRSAIPNPFTPGSSSGGRTLEGETKISGVRFLGPVSPSGEIEFTFDAVTPVHMKGNVEDPRIQKVLTHAMLNEDNPGIRLRAVSAVSTPSVEPPDREIKRALIVALRNDPNDGVRKEALNALRRMPFDADIKQALLETLVNDRNPGLRVAAINGLDSTRSRTGKLDRDILEVLRKKAQEDKNNYIRLKAQAVIEETERQ